MNIRMTTTKCLHLVSSVLLCLLAGCSTPANTKQKGLILSLQKQNDNLLQALRDTRNAIDAKKASNQQRQDKVKFNLEKVERNHSESLKFWLEHEKMIRKNGKGCFLIGTPAIVSSEKAPLGAAKFSVFKDIQVKYESCNLESYAMMDTLLLPQDAANCILMDNELGPMARSCKLYGFELLLAEKETSGSVALLVMEKNSDGTMSVVDKVTIKPKETDWKPVGGQYMLHVFFKDWLGALSIKKGQYWGLRVPATVKIPCSYLGRTGKERSEQFGVGISGEGGDIWVARDGDKLSFKRPEPKEFPDQPSAPKSEFDSLSTTIASIPTQSYTAEESQKNDTKEELGRRGEELDKVKSEGLTKLVEEEIRMRKTLTPAISMAVLANEMVDENGRAK